MESEERDTLLPVEATQFTCGGIRNTVRDSFPNEDYLLCW